MRLLGLRLKLRLGLLIASLCVITLTRFNLLPFVSIMWLLVLINHFSGVILIVDLVISVVNHLILVWLGNQFWPRVLIDILRAVRMLIELMMILEVVLSYIYSLRMLLKLWLVMVALEISLFRIIHLL